MSGVVLPSIREMFPEHLVQVQACQRPANQFPDTRTKSSFQSHPNVPPLHPNPYYHHQHLPYKFKPHSHAYSRSAVSSAGDPLLASSRKPPPALSPGHHLHSRSSVMSDDSEPFEEIRKRPNSQPSFFSFNVLKSDPSSSSLQHIASGARYPNRGHHATGHDNGVATGSTPAFRVTVPATGSNSDVSLVANSTSKVQETSCPFSGAGYSTIISFPVSETTNALSDPMESDESELSGPSNAKKHVCPTCLKRFNRPSSLKIHVNTHTGATPFQCPWPDCGREFNVNSNMRRHYRNHTSPGSARCQNPGDRRRRRRRAHCAATLAVSKAGGFATHTKSKSLTSSPPSSTCSASDESDNESSFRPEARDYLGLPFKATSGVYRNEHISAGYLEPYPQSLPPASLSRSESPSSLASLLSQHAFSPSLYHLSFRDSKVSTALRPAFGSMVR